MVNFWELKAQVGGAMAYNPELCYNNSSRRRRMVRLRKP